MTAARHGISAAGRVLGVIAVVALLPLLAGERSGAQDAPRPKVRVRRDIMSLAADGPEIAAFKKAVKVMKSRPVTDPTSWDFQANLHATLDNSNPAWNQCQHGNYFFAPWHRMYTYWFERIAREASGDPDFALPYWNYATPSARALPEVFRVPADATNPLYVSQRNRDAGGINNGARLPASVAASTWLCFRRTHFTTTNPLCASAAFGGLVVDAPVHLSSTMGGLETYHNIIHVLLGGENGFMSDPFGSSKDPLFWPHHNNVDRLWKRWLDQGGGRANPLGDRNWMDTRFTFFDEKGKKVEMVVKDALDTDALGYRFDDDPSETLPPQPGPAASTPAPIKPLAASKSGGKLGTEPVRVAIELGDDARAALARKDGSQVLLVEGLGFEKEPILYYEVYLNLPEKEVADYQSAHFVGNLIFAGVASFGQQKEMKHPKMSKKKMEEAYLAGVRAFDVTDTIRELHARKLWQEQQLTVTFVMRGLIPVNGAAVVSPGVKAQFEKVTLAGN